MKRPIIAIDGPSGAGKGTIARTLAAELGFRHIDTGAMYRAVGLKAVQAHVALDDEATITRLADTAAIEISSDGLMLDGVDITRAVRTAEIDRAAAAVARLPGVRALLVARQRQLGADGGVVMEGRDIGTVVFPDAAVKIYLDASPEERARRRAADPAHSAGAKPVQEVVTALAARDNLDRTRAVSPLYAASDAIVVDTTGKSVSEVVRAVMALAREKGL